MFFSVYRFIKMACKFVSQEDLNHYIQKMYEQELLTHGSCIIFRGGANNYRKFQCQVPSGDSVRPRVHVAVLCWKLGVLQMPDNLEASHLCHHKNCINPAHLNAEPQDINKNRIHCQTMRGEILDMSYCIGHGSHPDCLPWN